ncbi:uncharacterized protein LOC116430134 isoform X2 [Nomia melanderi]|uniref:uncharacterized protein LOC116430134 isoform X2 n=1 Tax=Nomia melanderi TaxID=2448451 RepID=UPI001303FCBF|nr:uncharacterized protein LOC116430134 isoform X2 [Nomia melanderi]
MSQHRRYAGDFTDTLNSFQYGTSSDTLDSISQDSLDQIKTCNFPSNGSTRTSKHSIILAGSYTKDSLVPETSTLVPSAPDLNKWIDLFQNDNLTDEFVNNAESKHSRVKVDNKENIDPQCAIRENTVSKDKYVLTPTSLNKGKRDTNYNIHRNKSDKVSMPERNIHKTITKSWPILLNCKNTYTDTFDTKYEYEQEATEINKFERILCSLDNKLNQIKEVSQSEPILKRLSEKFVNSPTNFTEKLVTIIEESVLNNSEDTSNTSAINLSRLTIEFRKMCKFIEDESWPEWAPSLPSTPPNCDEVFTSPISTKFINNKHLKKEKSFTTPVNTASPSTPLSATDVLKKRFFQKISRKNFNGSNDGMNLSSNMSSVESFERLEEQCNKLFPQEKEVFTPLQRCSSMPSLLSITQFKDICEEQMASLDVSNIYNKKETVSSTPDLLNKCIEQNSWANKLDLKCTELQTESDHKSIDFEYRNVSYTKKKSIKSNGDSNFNKVNVDKVTNDYTAFDTDELEKTLLQDIAQKRKRCLDTARLITEINADAEVMGDTKSLETSPEFCNLNESNSLANNEVKFLKTLMSCKNYLTYLEKQKPFFNLLERSESYTPRTPMKNKEITDIKNTQADHSGKGFLSMESPIHTKSPLNSNIKAYEIYDSPLSGKIDNTNREKAEQAKAKLFVTPGKNPPTAKYKKKKEYFPGMYSPKKHAVEDHILKSPHAKGLYRLNYNKIISPVGMYIRGTDMQLIKNVHAKPDDLLLTPAKKCMKSSPNVNSKQLTPLNGIINLSPKANPLQKQQVNPTNNKTNTFKNHFILPKTSYKLPTQVKTIKETKSPKQGTRVKQLMESPQSKVVTRHEELSYNKNKGIQGQYQLVKY